jgi:hypothetical protein
MLILNSPIGIAAAVVVTAVIAVIFIYNIRKELIRD